MSHVPKWTWNRCRETVVLDDAQIEKVSEYGLLAINIDNLWPPNQLRASTSDEELGHSLTQENLAFLDRHDRHFRKYLSTGRVMGAMVASSGIVSEPMDENAFYLEVAYALSGCQLVEEELKQYISDAFELVRKFVGTRMTFKLSGDQYLNSSLERLIDTFKKLSDNQPLVDELTKFKDRRNFLSHRGIAHCLDLEGDLFLSQALEFKNDLIAMRADAAKL
jgi:hypothetical protein